VPDVPDTIVSMVDLTQDSPKDYSKPSELCIVACRQESIGPCVVQDWWSRLVL